MFNLEWDQEEVKKAKEMSGRKDLPDGRYTVEVKETKIDMTRDYPRISQTLKVTEGDFKGRLMWANYSLSPKAKYIFASEMNKVGADVSACKTIDELASMMNAMEGKVLSVTKKTTVSKQDATKSFTNVYINDMTQVAESAGPKGIDTEEELGF